MPKEVLLGIDLGTTVLKAAAFAAGSGRTLAVASVRLPVRSGPGGMREQDTDRVDAALTETTGRLRHCLGNAWRRVAGIGLAAQGGSAILVDAASGRAHTPMQLWNDTRPLTLLNGIASLKTASYWRRLSYIDAPGAGLARILWLRQRHPRLFGRGTLYVGAGEYAYFQLTGEWRQDAGNALQIGCYDARHRCLSAAPLRVVGIDPSFVAPMRRGHETHPLTPAAAGRLKLPAGLPVAGPYIDQEAGYLSVAASSGRPLQLSLGTAWVGNFAWPRGRALPDGPNLVLPSPAGTGSLVLRVMLAGNVSWDWSLKAFAGAGAGSLARADTIFHEALLPPAGLTALPWLTRGNVFEPALAGSGGFVGIGPRTTRKDLLRAMGASLCFEMARVLEPVVRRGAADRVVLTGGAAGGWYFRELLSALFDPLATAYVPGDEPAGARGAVWAFDRIAATALTKECPRQRDALHREILNAYRRYCRVCRALARGLDDGGRSVFLDSHCKRRRP